MPHRHHRSGFTLTEVLVALVLFVLATSVLASSVNNAIRALETLEIRDGTEQDYRFVRSQIFTISDLTTFEQGGQIQTPDAGQAQWSANVTPTQTADLFQVQLTINLAGEGEVKPESDTRTYYLLRPGWTQDPTDRTTALQTFHDNLAKVRTNQQWP